MRTLNKGNKFRIALIAAIVLWAIFTAIHAFDLGGILGAILFFIPGLLGISTLIWVGFSRQECYLRIAPLSGAGLKALTLFTFLLIPILLSGDWSGWNAISVFIYAPASGIAQELFFRATLLVVLLTILKRKPITAIFLHSLLFALWHIPAASLSAPLGGAIAVTLVTFVGGMVWGWQVKRDKTIIWATANHCLFLMAMALFEWS